MNAAPDYFSLLAAAGFASRLIPITPPNCPVLADSILLKPRDNRGKAPGVINGGRLWEGLTGWTKRGPPSAAELVAWRGMGAGAGIRTGGGLIAIDADAYDPQHAALIKAAVKKRWPDAPSRIGQAPKELYLLRCDLPKRRFITFGEPGNRVEVLTGGQQFVAQGTHKTTGKPYEWTPGLPSLDDLPHATAEDIEAFLVELEAALPSAVLGSGGVNAGAPDQATLAGRIEDVVHWLRMLPNDERFNDRSRYITLLHAAKAACGDAALDVVQEWASRWTGGENDPAVVEKDFVSLKGPFRVGANWIRQQAGAAAWFEPLEAKIEIPESLLDAIETIDAAELLKIEPRPQRWIVRDLIPAQQVTLLSGDGGTGKSLIVLQLAAAMATGGDWLGEATERGGALFITAEDDLEEINRRLRRIAPGIPPGALEIASLWGRDAVIASGNPKNGLLEKTPMFGKLEKAIRRKRPVLTVLDTQADLFGGDEIKRIHARQFISMLQNWCREIDTTILLLAHPSVAGLSTGEGTSGSTAWSNSVRSRLYLERRYADREKNKEKIEIDPDIRVLTTKKSNRARVGRTIMVRYTEGVFVLQASGASVEDIAQNIDDDRVFMDLLDQTQNEGRDVAISHKAGDRYAPLVFSQHVKSQGISQQRFKAAMERLLANGEIKDVNVTSRKKALRRVFTDRIFF